MTEIELRFQIPAEKLPALRRWLSSDARQPAHSERLQAAYFDTPERHLARGGFALRLRLEGRRWVQTLKGAAPDGMTRLEHNVPLPAAPGEMPALDVQRHADHPAGQALLALLATLPPDSLQALFRTDIRRLSRPLRTRHGVVELALDEGLLLAGEGEGLRSTPVAELEIELKAGQPRAVLEVARRWALERFGLSLEQRTKALRGDLLARRQACAAVAPSKPLAWTAGQGRGDALHALLRAGLEPVLANASQIASGRHEPEHLHQLRVGLRRLRTGLLLLAGDDAGLQALAEGAGALSRALAPARDADVQGTAPWRRELEADWAAQQPGAAPSGDEAAPGLPLAAQPAATDATDAIDAASLLRANVHQAWMLALLAHLAVPPEHWPGDLAEARRQLKRWRAALRRPLRQFDTLEVEARHRLRRRLRRLRLAMELCAALAPHPKRHARELARVHRAQQRLGDLNDLEVALAQARAALAAQGAQAGFELGWLLPRRKRLIRRARRAVQRLAKRR